MMSALAPAHESPTPRPLARGFSQLESMPEGLLERMRRDISAGDIIGDRYKVLAHVSSGAMGKVYLAENLAIGLKVAIKLLKPELLANSDFRLRFKHEAEAVAAIQHQNVSRFLDLVVGDPTFLVMEYVPGPTLAEEIRRHGPLPARRAVDIAVRLCWGLHAAHRAGVVHRDLKPANILLAPDEEHGEDPKIIDFGLAKLAAAAAKGGAPLTRAGQIIGTPQYMAPEQIEGKDVDGRADLYAVGCVLYAMLTGRPPFLDEEDDADLLYRQVHRPPAPVRARAPEVSPELEAVVMRALAKDPAQRFASGRELAEALVPTIEKRRGGDGVDVHEGARRARRRDESTGVVHRLAPRRRWLWLAGALAIAGGGALGMVAGRRVRPAGALMVLSEPAGASLIVDGILRAERTPAALQDLAPGEHRLRVQRAHHQAIERYVQVKAGETTALQLQLEAQSHAVELESQPAGATVFLDGALVAGTTPLRLEVSDEEFHTLRLEKAGYQTWVQHLRPEDSAPLPPVVLVPDTTSRGTLFVDAAAPCEVWIDGHDSGFMTPTPGLRLAAGVHMIELHSGEAHRGERTRVTVTRGDTARLVLPLPR
jgi:tRNA A-37 threonylcarbamoyl transferase component Bud32